MTENERKILIQKAEAKLATYPTWRRNAPKPKPDVCVLRDAIDMLHHQTLAFLENNKEQIEKAVKDITFDGGKR